MNFYLKINYDVYYLLYANDGVYIYSIKSNNMAHGVTALLLC